MGSGFLVVEIGPYNMHLDFHLDFPVENQILGASMIGGI